MGKLLLERISKTKRKNEQFEVEVKDLKEALEIKDKYLSHFCASEYQYAETGRVSLDDKIYYISFNNRIFDGKYWESKNGKVYNDEVKEIFI